MDEDKLEFLLIFNPFLAQIKFWYIYCKIIDLFGFKQPQIILDINHNNTPGLIKCMDLLFIFLLFTHTYKFIYS